LAAGEPARLERERGEYLLVRASHATGWIQKREFKLICSSPVTSTDWARPALSAKQ
jgi:hypothetical protein